ncbi:MAG: hypothetical protein A2785_04275 [Candidatus Chisholmbacteria bacterium RIFCSPHIGHO2_01_FULL_49_18]|uniref:Antitoxin n=2 Tax=Candidatus Chisholmiibacteriota TaxID=1817900 RepID=A0A1G1VPD9_9BACT|nr:MAG: hypothetical protein A2785_04275 [Candidatus Chisholmbacteria bacterium RIFCSPHIGHO2_01_FULL_49_18]
MLQSINMLDLRRKIGEIIDQTLYRKERFLVKRKNKPVAVLVPLEDYELFMANDEDIELYSDKRISAFAHQDRLSKEEQQLTVRLLRKSKT